jgi:hypothetical protein
MNACSASVNISVAKAMKRASGHFRWRASRATILSTRQRWRAGQKEGCAMPERWSKPLDEVRVGDLVEETRYVWNPLARWMLGMWEEVGKQRYRVVAEFEIFDRDYPHKVSKIRDQHKDAVVIQHERRILVLVPEGSFVPKS